MKVKVACTQMACSWDIEANVTRAEAMVRKAAAAGANIVLLQELFETPYFCIDKQEKHFALAKPVDEQPTIKRLQNLARELEVVLPVSFFERDGDRYFNALVVIDADGSVIGHYRKSHIPDFPGYDEAFYFSPGDTGFRVFETRYGTIGVGICWDQWFPEAARAMVLQGADMLFYPTAIGNEIYDPTLESKDQWQTVMRGHAAANVVPVVASNRIGTESSGDSQLEFYGSSFICDESGAMLAVADRKSEAVLTAELDLDHVRQFRHDWHVFADRRTDLYGVLTEPQGSKSPGGN